MGVLALGGPPEVSDKSETHQEKEQQTQTCVQGLGEAERVVAGWVGRALRWGRVAGWGAQPFKESGFYFK